MFVYVYVYTNACMILCRCMYMYTFIYVCVVRIHTRVHKRIYVYMVIYTYMYTCKCMHDVCAGAVRDTIKLCCAFYVSPNRLLALYMSKHTQSNKYIYMYLYMYMWICIYIYICVCMSEQALFVTRRNRVFRCMCRLARGRTLKMSWWVLLELHMMRRGGGLGSSTIFKKFNEPYAPS